MKYDINFYDAYINGDLSNEEVALFEKAMETDQKLKEEFVFHLNVVSQIQQEKSDEFLQQIKQIRSNDKDKPKGFIRSSFKIFLIIFSIIAAISLGIISYTSFAKRASTQNELFALHFEPYDILNQRGGSLESTYQTLYIERDFESAYNIIKRIENLRSEDLLAKLSCELELDKLTEAKSTIQKLEVENNVLYKPELNWYKALFYLKINDLDSAEQALKLLLNNKTYGQKADEILNKM